MAVHPTHCHQGRELQWVDQLLEGMTVENHFKCPFCQPNRPERPSTPKKMRQHLLLRHAKQGVLTQGVLIASCLLPSCKTTLAKGRGHYHCMCGDILARKEVLLHHLQWCVVHRSQYPANNGCTETTTEGVPSSGREDLQPMAVQPQDPPSRTSQRLCEKMERFPVNQQTSSSKTHYPSGSESIAGPTDQEGHQGEDEQPTNQHKSMCYEGTSLTGPPVNKTRGRPRRSRGPVEGGKQILGKRNLEAMVVSLTEQNDSQLAKKQNKVQTGTAAEEKTSNKDNMREGGQTSTYLTRRKTKENESTEILHAPLRCLQTRQKGKPKKEMSKSVSATVVVRKSSPRRLVPEGPETAAMDADTQEPLTVGLSDQDSDSEGEELFSVATARLPRKFLSRLGSDAREIVERECSKLNVQVQPGTSGVVLQGSWSSLAQAKSILLKMMNVKEAECPEAAAEDRGLKLNVNSTLPPLHFHLYISSTSEESSGNPELPSQSLTDHDDVANIHVNDDNHQDDDGEQSEVKEDLPIDSKDCYSNNSDASKEANERLDIQHTSAFHAELASPNPADCNSESSGRKSKESPLSHSQVLRKKETSKTQNKENCTILVQTCPVCGASIDTKMQLSRHRARHKKEICMKVQVIRKGKENHQEEMSLSEWIQMKNNEDDSLSLSEELPSVCGPDGQTQEREDVADGTATQWEGEPGIGSSSESTSLNDSGNIVQCSEMELKGRDDVADRTATQREDEPGTGSSSESTSLNDSGNIVQCSEMELKGRDDVADRTATQREDEPGTGSSSESTSLNDSGNIVQCSEMELKGRDDVADGTATQREDEPGIGSNSESTSLNDSGNIVQCSEMELKGRDDVADGTATQREDEPGIGSNSESTSLNDSGNIVQCSEMELKGREDVADRTATQREDEPGTGSSSESTSLNDSGNIVQCSEMELKVREDVADGTATQREDEPGIGSNCESTSLNDSGNIVQHSKMESQNASSSDVTQVNIELEKNFRVAGDYFKCQLCQRLFPSYLRVREHYKIHEKRERGKPLQHAQKDKQCHQCGKMFVRVVDLVNHERYHKYAPKASETQEPVGKCTEEENLNDHYSIALKDEANDYWFQCRSCPFMVKHTNTIFRHWKAFHLDNAPFPYKMILREKLQKPKLVEGDEVEGDQAVNVPQNKSEVKSDIIEDESTYSEDSPTVKLPVQRKALLLRCNPKMATGVCKLCGFKSSMHGIRNHMRHHHSKYIYSCSICGQGFGILYTLRKHYWRHFDENGIRKPLNWRVGYSYKKDAPRFQCNHCQRKFHRKCDLQHHVKLGNNCMKKLKELGISFEPEFKDGYFVCPECGHKNKQRHHLLLHFIRRHARRPFKCDKCDKAFAVQDDLNKHMSCHVETKSFKCSICEKTFAIGRYLKAHLRRHVQTKRHFCHICGKGFLEKIRMREHVETHTREEDRVKPYHCSYCEKSFVNKQYLKDHENIHTGRYPYKCEKCDKTFQLRASCKRHMQYHSTQLDHVCMEPGCKKAFRFRSNLVAHQIIHTGLSKHTCNVCKKVYTTDKTLKRHRCKGLQIGQLSSAEPQPADQPAVGGGEVVEDSVEGAVYMCSECKVMSQSWDAIEQHMLTHVNPGTNDTAVEAVIDKDDQAVLQIDKDVELPGIDVAMVTEDGVTTYIVDAKSLGMVVGMSEQLSLETLLKEDHNQSDAHTHNMLQIQLNTDDASTIAQTPHTQGQTVQILECPEVLTSPSTADINLDSFCADSLTDKIVYE